MMEYIFAIVAAVLISAVFSAKLYYKLSFGRYRPSVGLQGKVVIITGATSGIGRATAEELVRIGAHVYLACRNVQKTAKIVEEIQALTGNCNVFGMHLELESLESVRSFVQEFSDQQNQLHILINNAGRAAPPDGLLHLTEDHIEVTLQSNYVGHFLLTALLLDKLAASAPSRIINVSSVRHEIIQRCEFELSNLVTFQKPDSFSAAKAYCVSKLAQILFTRQLARKLHNKGVAAYAVSPGFVWTPIFTPQIRKRLRFWRLIASKNDVEGAQTSLYCAVAPELDEVNCGYFEDCRPIRSSLLSRDEQLAAELWNVTAKVVGLPPNY